MSKEWRRSQTLALPDWTLGSGGFPPRRSIGTGGSIGREGPIVQIGSSLGSLGGQAFKLQTVMRHSTIGHLFPEQEADAVGRMRELLVVDLPEALRATGTENTTIGAQRQAQ